MPHGGQFACLCLDALLWIVFGAIVLYYTIEQTRLVEMNFAIVQGTDNVMQWWFYLATPVAWSLADPARAAEPVGRLRPLAPTRALPRRHPGHRQRTDPHGPGNPARPALGRRHRAFPDRRADLPRHRLLGGRRLVDHRLHAGQHRRHAVRGPELLRPAVAAAVHPHRRPDRRRRHRTPAGRLCARLPELAARRPGRGHARVVRPVRRHLGQQLGHHGDHRRHHAPAAGEGRLRLALRRRHRCRRWHGGHHHPAVDHLHCLRVHDEPVDLGPLRRRHPARVADGPVDDGGVLVGVAAQGLGFDRRRCNGHASCAQHVGPTWASSPSSSSSTASTRVSSRPPRRRRSRSVSACSPGCC